MNNNILENLIMVLCEQAEVEIKNNDYQKALTTLAQLTEYIADRPDHEAHGVVKRLQAKICKYQGKYQQALNLASEALGFYEKRSDFTEIYRVSDLKGEIYFHFCKYEETVFAWETALETASFFTDEQEKFRAKAKMHIKLGEVFVLLCQYKQGRCNYVKGLSYSRAVKDHRLGRLCQAGLGSTYHLENRFELALQVYYRTLRLARKAADQLMIGRILHNIGDIFTKLGEFSRARKIYEESLDISERNRDFLTSAATLREIGRLYLKDDPQTTATFCERSLDKLIENITIETRGECERLMGKAFYLMALYYYNQEMKQQAMSTLVEAGEIFSRYNMTKEKKRAEILYREIADRSVKSESCKPTAMSLMVKLGTAN